MLVKESSENERRTYEALNGSSLGEFAPRCFRSVDRGKKTLLYIEDLTAPYASPCVMDIKMGTRTFQEKEGDNPNRRLDLMQKMAKMDNGPQVGAAAATPRAPRAPRAPHTADTAHRHRPPPLLPTTTTHHHHHHRCQRRPPPY